MMSGKHIFVLASLLWGISTAQAAAPRSYDQSYGKRDEVVYRSFSWINHSYEWVVYATLSGINKENLREAADLNGKQEEYFDSDRSDIDDEHFHWVTDGHVMLWRGNRVINPPGTPVIDIASFRAYDRFAVDKNSIYFDGKRVASNNGVDLATLKMNSGRNSTTLTDKNTLYLKGIPQGSASGMTLLGEKSWDRSPEFDRHYKRDNSSDILIRFANKIYLNGDPINADADSFQLIRWYPDSLLIYRDKRGMKRLSFGRGAGRLPKVDCATFMLNEDNVQWSNTYNRSNDCVKETLPGVDPEQFHLLTERIAQYQDRLYVVKMSFFGEEDLEIIKLDTPDLQIDSRLSAGEKHGYFIHLYKPGSVQVFETFGKMHVDKKLGWDDRYVYTWDGDQLYRHASDCPAQAYYKETERERKLVLPDKCDQ
ncbi:DKNYY domain-containing protein [Escherichia sp. E4385]|uniref:DKNYY domain-containing protein n=1 Tax=Escherichia sp. E4385 TaxID=2040639 RepID=UPI00107F0793|nr:DKNYY domain-containing protein [Escherichia sp. E4385]TLI96879.1 DKNYY family protein [Escherichia sp. E4385]